MDVSGSMLLEDCFGPFSFNEVFSDRSETDFENEMMQNEISKHVEEVVKGIWSSVEHESACQEIRNFLTEFQQSCSFEISDDKSEHEITCHTSIVKEKKPECSTLESNIDCSQDEDPVAYNAKHHRQDSDVVAQEEACSLELISAVFQHWMNLIQIRQRQFQLAVDHHIKHRQRQCLNNWIQVFRRIKAEKVVQIHVGQKREHRRMQIANQFHILYQTQKHFQAWIIAMQHFRHKRATALAHEQELQRERTQLEIAAKYRSLFVLRQFLLFWKWTSNESKKQQEIEQKAALVKQKIQERIQQECCWTENKKLNKAKRSRSVLPVSRHESQEEKSVSNTDLNDIEQERKVSITKPQVSRKGGANRYAEISLENKLNAQLNQLAEMHNANRICKRFGWFPWRQRMKFKQRQLEQASMHYSNRKLKVVFFEWTLNILPKRWSAVVLEIERYGRALQFWRTHTVTSFVHDWRLVSWAEGFRRQNCTERAFGMWKRYRENSIEFEAFAVDFFEATLKRRSLTLWSSHFHTQVAAQERENSLAEGRLRDRLNSLKLRNRFMEWKLNLQDRKTCQHKRHTLDKVMQWIKEHRNNKPRITNRLQPSATLPNDSEDPDAIA